jgi:hypothetical protein
VYKCRSVLFAANQHSSDRSSVGSKRKQVLGMPSVARSTPPLRLDRERRVNVDLDASVAIAQADARKTILEPRELVSNTSSVSKLQQKISGSPE